MAYKPIAEVDEQNKYIGLDKWHLAGVVGSAVTVWNCEARTENHGEITERRIYDAAPDAKVITVGYSLSADSTQIIDNFVEYEGETYTIEAFIKEHCVKVITKSVGGDAREGTPVSKFWNDLKAKYNLIFFNSAGNDGEKDIGGALPPDVALYIGAANLIKGKPKRASYSSVGPQLDFMAFTGVWSGTSFASPYAAGIAACMCQLNRSLSQEDITRYFTIHAEDMEKPGVDDYTGAGLIKLGTVEDLQAFIYETISGRPEEDNQEPEEANLKTVLYIPIDQDYMTREIYSPHSNCGFIDQIKLDQPAVIDRKTGRTLIPVRAVAEALGLSVDWDNKTRTVILKEYYKEIGE